LIEIASEYNSFDQTLVEKVCVDSSISSSLEALGLDSVMRASVVRGICLFTDFDQLHTDIAGGEA
jgi:hypothetical protein